MSNFRISDPIEFGRAIIDSRLLLAKVNRKLAPIGLSFFSWQVLLAFSKRPGNQRVIAARVGIDKVAVCRATSTLNASGFVALVSDEGDRRQKVFRITKTGLAALDDANDRYSRIAQDYQGDEKELH